MPPYTWVVCWVTSCTCVYVVSTGHYKGQHLYTSTPDIFPCHQTMTKYTPVEPSTVIPNPPTVEDHISDVECSKVQEDEDKAHVPGRKKS